MNRIIKIGFYRLKSMAGRSAGQISRGLRVRPLLLPAILMGIVAYLLTAFTADDREYLAGMNNPFEDNGISDGDIITLQGKVDYLEEYESSYSGTLLKTTVRKVCLQGASDSCITDPQERITVYFPIDSYIRCGQWIRFKGKLTYYKRATNPGQFDTYSYYKNRGILFAVYNAEVLAGTEGYSLIKDGLCRLRMNLIQVLDDNLSEEDASVMRAMLLGDKSELNRETKALFSQNGISHILAISGLHISFLGMMLLNFLLLIRVPRPAGVAVSTILVFMYAMMVGFQPSAIRAVIMFVIAAIGKCIKRTYDMLSGMSLAFIILLIINPGFICDSGFRLSFLAVLGICAFFDSFRKHVIKTSGVTDRIASSFFIFSSTLPVIAGIYSEVNFFSVLLNVVIIPLLGPLLVFGMLLLLLGLVVGLSSANVILMAGVRLSAGAVTFILWLFKGTTASVENYISGRMVVGQPSIVGVLIFYALMMVACVQKGKRRLPRAIAIMAMAFFSLFRHGGDGLDIAMLDVGQGDCCVISSADGNMMIDGGSTDRKKAGEDILIPYLKNRGIDVIDGIVITHPDYDHYSAVVKLMENGAQEKLSITRLYIYEGFKDNEKMMEITDMARTKGIEVVYISRGYEIVTGDLRFTCIYPALDDLPDESDVNEHSLVLSLQYDNFDMLFTGDIEKGAEAEIVRDGVLDAYYSDMGNKTGTGHYGGDPIEASPDAYYGDMGNEAGTGHYGGDPIEASLGTYRVEMEGGISGSMDAYRVELEDGISGSMDAYRGESGSGISGSMGIAGLSYDIIGNDVNKQHENADILKVAHHGSDSSSTEEFLELVAPEVAVISVGAGNSYGHPAEGTLSRLDDAGCKVLRTDESGCISIHVKRGGRSYYIEGFNH